MPHSTALQPIAERAPWGTGGSRAAARGAAPRRRPHRGVAGSCADPGAPLWRWAPAGAILAVLVLAATAVAQDGGDHAVSWSVVVGDHAHAGNTTLDVDFPWPQRPHNWTVVSSSFYVEAVGNHVQDAGEVAVTVVLQHGADVLAACAYDVHAAQPRSTDTHLICAPESAHVGHVFAPGEAYRVTWTFAETAPTLNRSNVAAVIHVAESVTMDLRIRTAFDDPLPKLLLVSVWLGYAVLTLRAEGGLRVALAAAGLLVALVPVPGSLNALLALLQLVVLVTAVFQVRK